jgi:ABC-type arginine transport system permease subunit
MNPWVAGALALGFVFKPLATRLLAGIFSAVTIADFLHEASEAAKKK